MMSENKAEQRKVSASREDNAAYMNKVLPVQESFDVIQRDMLIGGRMSSFYFIDGFTKDEVKVSLENGYLTVQAAKGLDQDEQEKKTGRYIRRERYAGACERSFYVGEDVTQEEIKGEFKHGILRLSIPKKEAKPAVPEKKYIVIE